MDIAPTIAINKLSKRYAGSDSYAIQDLSLNVMPGEVYGFLGPNGAGKSTTIRLLLNFLLPTSGNATILGQNIVSDSVELKRSIGYLAGDVALYPKMTGRQLLDYMSALTPVKHASYLDELIETYQAELDKPINQLSKGNRQKIGLIQAFMHEPEVLILDEPTSGLDPLMQAAFFNYVQEAKRNGASVFLSSHDLAEVQKMCDRIGFIRNGRLAIEQTIGDLNLKAGQTYDITFAAKPPMSELKRIDQITVTPLTATSVAIHLRGDLSPLFAILAKHKVVSLERRETNLEEEFMQLYKREAA
jgi:ABC-2 type transport system ATP-binding protein